MKLCDGVLGRVAKWIRVSHEHSLGDAGGTHTKEMPARGHGALSHRVCGSAREDGGGRSLGP